MYSSRTLNQNVNMYGDPARKDAHFVSYASICFVARNSSCRSFSARARLSAICSRRTCALSNRSYAAQTASMDHAVNVEGHDERTRIHCPGSPKSFSRHLNNAPLNESNMKSRTHVKRATAAYNTPHLPLAHLVLVLALLLGLERFHVKSGLRYVGV